MALRKSRDAGGRRTEEREERREESGSRWMASYKVKLALIVFGMVLMLILIRFF